MKVLPVALHVAAVWLLSVCSPAATALPIGPFGPERIERTIPASPPYVLQQDYFIAFASDALVVHTEIQFTPAAGVAAVELAGLKSAWETGIESAWSNRFDAVWNGTLRFPILIDVTFEGPLFNHEVTVRPGPAVSSQHMWDTWDTAHVAAHEFGHMLGLFDEYAGGAMDPAGSLLDPTGIMGSTQPGALAHERYYAGFLGWLAAKDPSGQYALAARVPEPHSLTLLAIALLGAAAVALRRQSALTRSCRRFVARMHSGTLAG